MAKSWYGLPKIALIACGGTIGGEWSPVHDTVISSKTGNKRINEYLCNQARLHRKIDFVDLFNKDSRQITRKDTVKVYKAIGRLRSKGIRHFLITHGTFTMTSTAGYIARQLAIEGIRDTYIVLCGSFIPVTGFAPSDAQFNVGFAMAKLASMHEPAHAGSWICMNGLLSRPSALTKKIKKARFQLKARQ